MEISQIYIMIAIVVLVIVALFVFVLRKNKKREKFTILTGVAFGFIIAGILFGDTWWVGYGLMGIGVIIAVIDMILKLRKKKK